MANYFGVDKQFAYVDSKKIHWSGGRLEPPSDTPPCGFDGSQCQDDGKYSKSSFLSLTFFFLEITKKTFNKTQCNEDFTLNMSDCDE